MEMQTARHDRKTRATSPDPDSIPTPDEHTSHTRQGRNRVGKRYRDKLNSQFESLQAVLHLPNDDDDENPDLGEPGDGKSNTTNKAKVLDMARERIQMLMREREELRVEREALLRERACVQ